MPPRSRGLKPLIPGDAPQHRLQRAACAGEPRPNRADGYVECLCNLTVLESLDIGQHHDDAVMQSVERPMLAGAALTQLDAAVSRSIDRYTSPDGVGSLVRAATCARCTNLESCHQAHAATASRLKYFESRQQIENRDLSMDGPERADSVLLEDVVTSRRRFAEPTRVRSAARESRRPLRLPARNLLIAILSRPVPICRLSTRSLHNLLHQRH